MRESNFAGISGLAAVPLLAAGLLAPRGFAELGPTPGSYALEPLFAQADAVCVGQVQHPVETVTGADGYVKAVSRSVGLLAHRCYKGSVSPRDTIEYATHVPGIHATDTDLPGGGEVLVFLKETRPHVFTLAFPFFGRLWDASLGTLAPETGTGLEQLQRDIVASTKGVMDWRVLVGNFRVLHGFPSLSGEALALPRSYSQDVDPEVAMGAFAALAKFGNPADLAALCEYVNRAGGQRPPPRRSTTISPRSLTSESRKTAARWSASPARPNPASTCTRWTPSGASALPRAFRS